MLNFEQVKLLEEKVTKAVEYVERINREKNALLKHEAELKGKIDFHLKREAELQANLDSKEKQETELHSKLKFYQGRIDELEVLVTRFKEDHGKIEESILSALDRLSRFEHDIEKSLPKGQEAKPDGEEAPETYGDDPVVAETAEATEDDGETEEGTDAENADPTDVDISEGSGTNDDEDSEDINDNDDELTEETGEDSADVEAGEKKGGKATENSQENNNGELDIF
jgi:DNA repair exonuclease SbcCD ATPase subunit